jgi:TRAP-type C4-dicarboxylate transport system permease small subunit
VKRLGVLVESVAAVLLAVVVGIVLVQVFGRYILRMSLSWPEELARYVLVWLMFFGVAAAAASRSQIVVDTLLELVSPRVRRVLEAIATLAGLVAVALLVWTSRPLFGPASRSTSPATGIPSFWIYVAIPVGGVLLGLFALADLGRLLRKQPLPSGAPGTAADPSTSPGPGVP